MLYMYTYELMSIGWLVGWLWFNVTSAIFQLNVYIYSDGTGVKFPN